MVNLEDRIRGCLYGLAIGDALGASVEFKARDSFEEVTGYRDGGPFNLPAGTWTDDTSMALCLAESLTESGGFDPHDQLDRYLRWYRDGYLSCTGRCFDIGNTTRRSLEVYEQESGNPYPGSTDPMTAGNGSLMRLAPIPVYFNPDTKRIITYAAQSSRTTHGTQQSVDACIVFALLTAGALNGVSKERLLDPGNTPFEKAFRQLPLHPGIRSIVRGDYRVMKRSEIEGSGYVVKSLRAALWCFWHSDSFEQAVLEAVNLGDDADTTGAVTGQIAGACYGLSSIPERFITGLRNKEVIEKQVSDLLNHAAG